MPIPTPHPSVAPSEEAESGAPEPYKEGAPRGGRLTSEGAAGATVRNGRRHGGRAAPPAVGLREGRTTGVREKRRSKAKEDTAEASSRGGWAPHCEIGRKHRDVH